MAIYHLDWDEAPDAVCQAGAVTVGNFDGVHRGHASLLAELRRQAHLLAGPAVALTFDPHPLQLLRPDQFQPVLTTTTDRTELILAAGAEHVIVVHTTPELLHLLPEEFFEQVIRSRLKARGMVEGTNFGFGRNRTGNADTLAALCRPAGLRFILVPPLTIDGITVSSSRVRDELLRGKVRLAADLLGRSFHLRGTVGRGQRRGQKLGFPTANLEQIETLIPRDGVYAVRVHQGDRSWPGAANIGPNPTFGEHARKIEVHLIGFQGDLYGTSLRVEFLDRLRDTRPFANVAELTQQLRTDVEQARNISGRGGTSAAGCGDKRTAPD